MNNGATNKAFLMVTDKRTKQAILNNIAKHYGISTEEAFDEVVDEQAERLLDYLTGPERAATSVLMQRHGLA